MIHAPHINWVDCGGPVYINPATGGPGNDQSVASTLSVLPNVIEKSERVAIMHGLAVRVYVFLLSPISLEPVPGLHSCRRRHSDRYPVRDSCLIIVL